MPARTREEANEQQRRWYYKHKKQHIDKVKAYRKKVNLWYKEYKKTLVCKTCGENDYRCLDFHHIDKSKKKFNVASKAHAGSKAQLVNEISKCVVLCANCHRKETAEQS